MFSCDEAARHIVRASDGMETLDASSRAMLEAHLEGCASCRAALETQRTVAAWLRMRPADRVSPELVARLAARLDEASGWFGIADWRVWTLRLAPVAAGLALAILLGADASTDRTITIDDWTLGSAENASDASLLWQSDVSPESLIETLLTGDSAAGGAGADHVR